MYINIQDKKEYSYDFMKWVVKRIFIIGLDYISQNKEKLIPIDNYFTQVFNTKRKITAFNVIVTGLRNIKMRKNSNGWILYMDDVQNYPFTTTKLQTLCQLINYGNTELNPYPIFSNVLNAVKDNIKQLYTDYSYGSVI